MVPEAASARTSASPMRRRWSAEAAESSAARNAPAGARELVGVDADSHAGRPRGGQDRPRLVDREDALLAEDVAEARRSGRLRQDLLDDRAHPLATALEKLGRDLVRGEKRRHDARQVALLAGAGQQPRAPQLVADRQSVSGLGLDGRRAVRAHAKEPRVEQRLELLVRSGARRPDGGVDAAARRRDRGIALAGEAPADLGAAVARPDRDACARRRVRAAASAGRVDRDRRPGPAYSRRVVGARGREHDAAVLDAQRRLADSEDLALRGPPAGEIPSGVASVAALRTSRERIEDLTGRAGTTNARLSTSHLCHPERSERSAPRKRQIPLQRSSE